MTFGQSVWVCFAKYAVFDGRASRSEYWWFSLFCLLAGSVAGFAEGVVEGVSGKEYFYADIVLLLTLIPSYAVSARRLHDTDKSGWNILWAFTIIGIIPLLIWYCSEGSKEANTYGSPIDLGEEANHVPSESSSSATSLADEITKFAELRDKGIISEEEFSKKKEELLG